MDAKLKKALQNALDKDETNQKNGINELINLSNNDGEAAYLLARIYLKKVKNTETAITYYNKAIELNYLLAYQDIGALYQMGMGLEKNIPKAIECYKLCGNAISIYSVGRILYDGNEIEKDYEKAASCFKEAANGGYPDAFGMIGIMYYNGEFFDKNITMAMYWLEKCFDAGKTDVALMIANTYNSDNDILNDNEIAFEWYSKGSERGNATCSYILGGIYANGNNVIFVDEEKALELYLLAAEQGEADGLIQAGMLYIKGKTIPKNYIMAEKLFFNALDRNAKNATKAIKYLELMKQKNGISTRVEQNSSFSGTRLYESGYTGLAEQEYKYEQQKKAEEEKRREMLYAASAVSTGNGHSYIDVDAGVVFNENMEMVSIIDEDTGIILSKDDISFYDKDTHITYTPGKGIVEYDPDTKMSYNYSKGDIVWHDGNMTLDYN